MPPPRPLSFVPSSSISGFIDVARIDALLAPWVPNAEERSFVVRCIIAEGPAHHRGANFVLLSLLGRVLEGLGPSAAAPPPKSLPVPMRLPPHLAGSSEHAEYPLRLSTAPLEQLAQEGSREFAAMVDCLTDGPPQHALANVAMVALLSAILERLEAAH